MFKSKLQEICHQQKWGLPKYNFIKEGPDHNPSFKASVTVNDVTFDTTIYSKSSKEAQNSAAELAVLHFTASEPRAEPKTGDPVIEIHQAVEIHSDSSVFKNDELNSYKMMLQTYTQRKKVGMPVYTSVKTGLPHALCFKATVIVAGHPFESPRSYKTLKEAEHAAAQVALLSFTLDDFQQIGSPLYKNMLQELAQNEGFTLPKYKTEHCFELHYPSFISTVEVEGEIFHGAAARSKKQAESNAAKVAYTAFMERKRSRIANSPSSSSNYEATEVIPGSASSSPINLHGHFKSDCSAVSTHCANHSVQSFQEKCPNLKESSKTECYLLCNRFKVYTSIPDIDFPKGTCLLPIAEDKWIVVSLECPNQIDSERLNLSFYDI